MIFRLQNIARLYGWKGQSSTSQSLIRTQRHIVNNIIDKESTVWSSLILRIHPTYPVPPKLESYQYLRLNKDHSHFIKVLRNTRYIYPLYYILGLQIWLQIQTSQELSIVFACPRTPIPASTLNYAL